MVPLNAPKLFPFNLTDYHPRLRLYCYIVIALRAAQLLLILFWRQGYWRHRVPLLVLLKAVQNHLQHPAALAAGAARPGFLRHEWLSGGTGVVTSSRAIWKALLLPTGALSNCLDAFEHYLPFRLALPLQLLCVWGTVRASWRPVAEMLSLSPRLRGDARVLCEAASDSAYFIAGLGVAWDDEAPDACGGGLALTRPVLLVQLLLGLLLPLLLLHAVELEAKRAFCRRVRRDGARGEQPRGVVWALYVLAAVLGLLLCDVACDLVHWMGLAPPLALE